MSQDFSHQNLQGRSFQGQDLTGANFSHADIRGADFSNAVLKDASFRYATAGLHLQGVIIWTLTSLLFSTITGWLLVEVGAEVGNILSLEFINKYSVIPGAIVLILLTIASIITIRQGITEAWITVAIPWLLAEIWAMCLVGNSNQIVLGIYFLAGILLAANRFPQPKKAIAIVLAGAIIVALAVFIAGAFFGSKIVVDAIEASNFYIALLAIIVPGLLTSAVTIARSVAGNFGVAIVGAVVGVNILLLIVGLPTMSDRFLRLASPLALFIVVAVGLFSVYVTWRIITKHEEFNFDGFVMLSGYTNFYSADLTNVDFTGAALQQTNFTKAILIGICLQEAKNLDRAKFDRSLLN